MAARTKQRSTTINPRCLVWLENHNTDRRDDYVDFRVAEAYQYTERSSNYY